MAALVAAAIGVALGIGFGRVAIDPNATAQHAGQQAEKIPPATPRPIRPPAVPPPAARPIYEEPLPRNGAVPPPVVAQPLPPVIEQLRHQPPPAIAGTPAWQQFAAAAPDVAGRPIIAIVIDDVGHDPGRQAERLRRLPGPVTLALLPYGHDLPRLAAMFRAAGHEILVHMPMEPTDAKLDPGPDALMTTLPESELVRRLQANLGHFEGFVGINNHMGSRFTADPHAMGLVMAEVKRRGLLFLDSRTTGSSTGERLAGALDVPRAIRDVFLDNDVEVDKILAQLAATERVAQRKGYAVAIGHPHEETLEALERWLPQARQRGFVLVPLTAIVRVRLAG